MSIRVLFQQLCQVQILRLVLLIISIAVAFVVLATLIVKPYENFMAIPSPAFEGNLVREFVNNDNASTKYEEVLDEWKAEVAEKDSDVYPRSLVSPVAANLTGNEKQDTGTKQVASEPPVLVASKSTMMSGKFGMEGMMKPTRLSYMISALEDAVSAYSMKSKSFSARDRELQDARLQIEKAPTLRSTGGLHPYIFRNVSKFLRSYKMMETTLRVYIYKEGEKPIFHDPKLRGIYASEGWFMKLMEGNKKFLVKDPKKAHLFYLPFSSLKLRNMLHEKNFVSHKALEQHLKNYTDLISRKYRFWNRTNGADHFLVACHDWAQKLTKDHMGNCIRALCNSNLAGGFKIGKDITLPATYIRTSENPVKDLGGNPPMDRPILAFFAGGMHGSLRPLLLQHWHDKEPDMKIFGPMARDVEGKARYREYMKSSKYCLCARGYEVYTPRIVESIYYECVPVIISDNYVPPFIEVLDWEAFAVFVLEKDVVNLRSILLSISEDKYRKLQEGVKMVQQHFIWNKKPKKLDLFHMILHSVWNSRVFQLRPR